MNQTERMLHFAPQCEEDQPVVDELYIRQSATFPSEANVTALRKDVNGNTERAYRLAPIATRISVDGPVMIDMIDLGTVRISAQRGRVKINEYLYGEIWAEIIEDDRKGRR